MQENRPVSNDEIEIDLVELFGELKKNIKLIAGVTASFAAAAAIYSFAIAKPVYQHNVLLRLPANANTVQINSYTEVLKSQIGLVKGLSAVNLFRNSSVIQLSFSDGDSGNIKTNIKTGLPVLTECVNKIFIEEDKRRFSNDIIKNIKNDVSSIHNKLLVDEISSKDAKLLLEKLIDKVDYIEENYAFPKVEVIQKEEVSTIPVSPNKKKNIAIATVLGLFISCGYVIGKFMLKK